MKKTTKSGGFGLVLRVGLLAAALFGAACPRAPAAVATGTTTTTTTPAPATPVVQSEETLVPVGGEVTSRSGVLLALKLRSHKHGRGFTQGTYELTVRAGAASGSMRLTVVKHRDWFGEAFVAGHLVQVRGRVPGKERLARVVLRKTTATLPEVDDDQVSARFEKLYDELKPGLERAGHKLKGRGWHRSNGAVFATISAENDQHVMWLRLGGFTLEKLGEGTK